MVVDTFINAHITVLILPFFLGILYIRFFEEKRKNMKRMVEEYGLIVVVICLLFLMLAFFMEISVQQYARNVFWM